MVRLKHRYLLVDILYPPQPGSKPTSLCQQEDLKEFHLQVHRPTPDTLTPHLFAKVIRENVAEMFGDWGMGRLGGSGANSLSVKYLSPATSTAIIRCPRASYRLVWSALTYMSGFPARKGQRPGAPETGPPGQVQHECIFRVVRVSGTMRKVEQEAIRRARMEVVRLTNEWESGGKGALESMFSTSTSRQVKATGPMEIDSEDDDDDEDSEA
ncbi:hypothetical protein FQN57_002557 [Myotisia sp. PD_48]|nr:hypothetical protein FQN57_002557 [Myotisia sp. PD_48]